jgi:hypothetical protein
MLSLIDQLAGPCSSCGDERARPVPVVAFPDGLLSTEDAHFECTAAGLLHWIIIIIIRRECRKLAGGLLLDSSACTSKEPETDRVERPGTYMIALLTGLSGSLLRPRFGK